MTENLYFLTEYFKTNYFTAGLFGFLGLASIVKYFSFRIQISPKAWLFLILILGTGLRFVWILSSPHEPRTVWSSNVTDYDLINLHAMELLDGKWFLEEGGAPSGRRPIGFPIFLAILYKIFGIHNWVAWGAHLSLSLITCYLIYLIGRILAGETLGLIAAAFYSLFPISIYSAKLITDEHLFLPVWYFGIYLLLKELKGVPLKLGWLWYGLIFGISTITRTHSIYMPLIVGLVYFLNKSSIKKVLLSVLLTGLVMQLINAPWVFRNYKAWGVPVLYTATNHNLYEQVNSTARPDGGGRIPEKGDPGYSEELQKLKYAGNPGRYHQICGKEMTTWIMSQPLVFLNLGFFRVLDFMCWNRKRGVWPLWNQFETGFYKEGDSLLLKNLKLFEEISFQFYYILLFASICSVSLILGRWKRLNSFAQNNVIIMGSIIFFWLLEHMIIIPDRKYRYPLEPIMIVIAAYFILYLIRDFRWESLLQKLPFFQNRKP